MAQHRHPRNRLERRIVRARWARHPLAVRDTAPDAAWRLLGMEGRA